MEVFLGFLVMLLWLAGLVLGVAVAIAAWHAYQAQSWDEGCFYLLILVALGVGRSS